MRQLHLPERHVRTPLAVIAAVLSLAACGQMGPGGGTRGVVDAAPPAAPRTSAAVQSTAAVEVDTVVAPLATNSAATATGRLGTTVASLGAAGEAGLWLKTPLVKARTNGRVVNPETGKSAKVVLLPLAGGGSGSQASLAAMQALGADLTDLPTVEVFTL